MKVLFMIPRDDPPRLPATYSANLRDFVAQCLEKKQNSRPSASELLKHPFITSSRLNRDFVAMDEKPSVLPLNQDITTNTLKKKRGGAKKEVLDEWDFSSSNSHSLDIPKILGKNVAFEDEFDSELPGDYREEIPLGYDLMKSIVIPAFADQKSSSNEESKICLDSIIKSLELLAMKDPKAAEHACRRLLENILGSTRQSLKEFVASITIHSLDNYQDFDEQDSEKLDNIRVEEIPGTKSTTSCGDEKQSKIALYLLKRWMQR
jgi:serine/threonine protein kinase